MNHLKTVFPILFWMLLHQFLQAGPVPGQVVWWGRDIIRYPGENSPSVYSNGVVACGDQVLSNAVAIAAGRWHALALKSDGTVCVWGDNYHQQTEVPAGLDNVTTIATGQNFSRAFRRDGTVVEWGSVDEIGASLPAGLSNVVEILAGPLQRCAALKKDGTVLSLIYERMDPITGLPERPVIRTSTNLITTGGRTLRNIVAIAPGGMNNFLALNKDGALLDLKYTMIDPATGRPAAYYQYASADLVTVAGQVLTNIAAISTRWAKYLALKRDGTVVSWPDPPVGLVAIAGQIPSNVVAVSAGAAHSLALKRDGTVVAWGNNDFGQTIVPTWLSNVVAIAAGDGFSLAITTGPLPPVLYPQAFGPLSGLDRMSEQADLVFKGQVLSTTRITNAAFRISGMSVNVTKLKVISILKGDVPTNVVEFQHYVDWLPGGHGWSGALPPAHYRMESGQSYLLFAARTDKPDKYFSPMPDTASKPDEFRQIADFPTRDDEGVLRTLDNRPLGRLPIKDAHWFELNLLVTNRKPTDQLYAIEQLEAMSKSCLQSWRPTKDFKREEVLKAVLPLVTNANDQVAVAAIGCFQVSGSSGTVMPTHGGIMPVGRGCSEVPAECAAQISPHAATLIQVANSSPSVSRRMAAIAAFSCTKLPVVSNSLPQWLRDPAEDARSQAVLLLPDFPGEFSEQALRERAADASPKVRAAVADAIGNGRIESLLPTLEKLFSDPVGLSEPKPPLTIEQVQEGAQVSGTNVGDVHTSAGYALLKFEVEQVRNILKTNLNDKAFRPGFLCKLAENDAGPWLKDLAEVMEARRIRIEQKADADRVEPKHHYLKALLSLSGTYYRCWNIICTHLMGLPQHEFENGKLNRYLDVLENAGDTGSREPLKIYELYRMKRLNERAARFRAENEQRLAAYNINQFFDRVDATYTNSPVKPKP